MAYSIGGMTISSMEITKAWGNTPATARITGVGGRPADGAEGTISFGGATFTGIVMNSVDLVDEGMTQIEMADNRVRLGTDWDWVYCRFNTEDVVEDDISTPGIDRKKRYFHIFPEDFDSGKPTYTDKPLTCREILDKILDASTVSFSWSYLSHSALDAPGPEVDAYSGRPLGNVIQDLLNRCGLQLGIRGKSQLWFSVRGDGAVPSFPQNSSNRSKGSAVGGASRVRIVGERNLVQQLTINLEPAWNRHYEQYFFLPTWVARVASLFGIADAAQAQIAARKVTLRNYFGITGDGADYLTFDGVSRMEIPVWIYIQSIVWKAYRIPPSHTVSNASVKDFGMAELIQNVVLNGSSLAFEPGSFYPGAKAVIAAKGVGLDLLDLASVEGIRPDQIADLNNQWRIVGKWKLEDKERIFLFEAPVFSNGSGNSGLFKEVDGFVVPNANFAPQPAEVKASVCWAAYKYMKESGGGSRVTSVYVAGLSRHLVQSGGSISEVTYADGKTCDQKAAEIAGGRNLQGSVLSGGYTQHGYGGTELNGAISRVTTVLDDSGISERVDFSKERSSERFESEVDLERKRRVSDLFPGQEELKKEIERIERLARMQNAPTSPSSLSEVMQSVPGTKHCEISHVVVPSDPGITAPTQLPSGSIVLHKDNVWNQALGDAPCVTLADGSPIQEKSVIVAASSGIVPVRVQGPLYKGSAVGVSRQSTDGQAYWDGTVFVGKLISDQPTEEVKLAWVQLGAYVAGSAHPWKITDASTPEGAFVKVAYGNVGTFPPVNYNAVIPVSGVLYIWLVLHFGENGALQSLELDWGASQPENSPPDETLPSEFYVPVGWVQSTEGKVTQIYQSLYHSLSVTVVLTDADCFSIRKSILIMGV